MKEDPECDHEFEHIGPLKDIIKKGIMGETLEIPVKCKHCELKAREIWIYSCTLTNDNNPV